MAQDTIAVRRDWARLGALARLQQIEEERFAILAAFPDLRRKRNLQRSASALVVRKPRTISAKGRKAMSAGMRKYWAKRRAEQRSKSA
jgi:hypothetical protein